MWIYTDHGEKKTFEAVGNGPIDAVQRGMQESLGVSIKVLDYEEHALQSGSNSQAAAYIHLLDSETGRVTYGVGVSSNITVASIRALFSAVNRLGLGKQEDYETDYCNRLTATGSLEGQSIGTPGRS